VVRVKCISFRIAEQRAHKIDFKPRYPELAKDTSRSHDLGQQLRTVQGHRARPQISGCLAGRQSSTLGGRRYAQLAFFGQNFTLNEGSSAGRISNEGNLLALEDKRTGTIRAGGLRPAAILWAGDFTAGFLGGVDLLQLSNLQGPGARARPALAPGPQQYHLVRPSGARLAFCSSSRQIKAAALRGFPLRRRNHDQPGCRSFLSASLGKAAGRRTQYTILLRGWAMLQPLF